MGLKSPRPYPEMIFLYGRRGAGKTRAAMSVAALHADCGSDATFRVIDTDYRWGPQLEEFDSLKLKSEGGNIELWTPYDFGEFLTASKEISARSKPGDWVIYDRATVGWKRAARYYVETRLGTTQEALEEAYRSSGKDPNKYKKGTAILEYYGTGINPMYEGFEDPLFYRGQPHVICLANSTKIVDTGSAGGPQQAKELRMAYEQIGELPQCKNDTDAKFHTVIHLKERSRRMWEMKTARDVGRREYLNNTQVEDFAFDYLINVAGWEMT